MGLVRRLLNSYNEKRITKLVQGHTLVGPARIRNLHALAQRIESERIPGDVMECGVYKGGTAAVLARTATRSKLGRTVWLFDSFQGMPKTTEFDGEAAREYVGKLTASSEEVMHVLRRAGADLNRVRIISGMFEDTFPRVHIKQIALLNVDCDWYESVKLCLETFYGAVVSKGFISFDDYGHWPGCRLAVDGFFKERGLMYPLRKVDYSARWFQKL